MAPFKGLLQRKWEKREKNDSGRKRETPKTKKANSIPGDPQEALRGQNSRAKEDAIRAQNSSGGEKVHSALFPRGARRHRQGIQGDRGKKTTWRKQVEGRENTVDKKT